MPMGSSVRRRRAWKSILAAAGATAFAVFLLDAVSLSVPRGGRMLTGDAGGGGFLPCEGMPIPAEYAYPGAGVAFPECAFQCSLMEPYFLLFTDSDAGTQRLRAFQCAKGSSCDPADGGLGAACDSGIAVAGSLLVDVLFRGAGSLPPSAAASSASSQDAITAWHPAPEPSAPGTTSPVAASSSSAAGPVLPLPAPPPPPPPWRLGIPVTYVPPSSGSSDSSKSSSSAPSCGNGLVEEGEECDDGSGNGSASLTTGGTRESTCTEFCQVERGILPRCGDGSLGAGEECDAGPGNGVPGSACDAQCRIIRPSVPLAANVTFASARPAASAQTGPAALLAMATGAAAGWVWMRRRRGRRTLR